MIASGCLVVLLLGAIAVCERLMRRDATRIAMPKPWSLTPEESRRRFDQVRAAIPVDDDELANAKPVGPRWKRHEQRSLSAGRLSEPNQ